MFDKLAKVNKRKCPYIGFIIVFAVVLTALACSLGYSEEVVTPYTTYYGNGGQSPHKLYSVHGLDEYGIIKDGKAYMSREGSRGSALVSFWVKNGEIIRCYDISGSYGTAPLLEHGILAQHSWMEGGFTTAFREEDGAILWTAYGQPGHPMGMAYYEHLSKGYLYVSANNGLHCLNFDTGELLWHFQAEISANPVTPVVDDENGWLYYQSDNKMWKLDAVSGKVIWNKPISGNTSTNYWATILLNDKYAGYQVLAHWLLQNKSETNESPYSTVIYSFSSDGVTNWKIRLDECVSKSLTCYKGVVAVQSFGNLVRGFNATNGEPLWQFDSKDSYSSARNFGTAMIVVGERLVIVTTEEGDPWGPDNGRLFFLDPPTGRKLGELDLGMPRSSCAYPIASEGVILVPNLYNHSIEAWKVGEGDKIDFYPFRGSKGQTGAPENQRAITQWYPLGDN